MKPLRLSVFFFSVIFVLAVSQVSLAQPPAPVLLQPPYLKNVTPLSPNVQNTTPLLQWVSQDMSYRIEISYIEENEEKIVAKKDIPKARYKVTLVDKLERFKVYYWQITAINTERVESQPSEKRSFKTGDFPWTCGDPGIDIESKNLLN